MCGHPTLTLTLMNFVDIAPSSPTGFDGVFTPKESDQEGLATYWRRSRYRMVEQHVVRFRKLIAGALEGDVPPSVAPVLPVIKVRLCFALVIRV